MIIADLKSFTNKNKLIIFIRAFIKLYNLKNRRQVHKFYRIVEFEKMYILMAKHLCNLAAYYIVKISLILRTAYIISKNQKKIVFYVNNYIN